jgi:starch synthase
MRVAMISAECEPWAKTGGLGDVVDALARGLPRVDASAVARGARRPDRRSDHTVDAPVDVFLPRYRGIALPKDRSQTITVTMPDARSGASIEVAVVPVAADGYRLRLVDYPPAFDRDGIYGHPDDAWRFTVLARAALEALRSDVATGGRPVDVLHLHDWHATPALLDRDGRLAGDPVIGRSAALLTAHNLAYHGWVPLEDLGLLGLVPGHGQVASDAAGIDLLWDGIERAELVNTVSLGFAAEALTPGLGFGLDGTLRAKGDRFFGILNGLDTRIWDPATDGAIAAPYSQADRTGKAACRQDLLGKLGLDATDPGLVLGMVGRLDRQKGFDLVVDAAPRLLDRGARLVVQASGDRDLAAELRALAAARPYQVAFVERFDRAMARRIYAGSDAFLMPSRFEPCGQSQMIALRYGTPPIVHATGGLRDTVVDEHDQPGQGTGFAFRWPTAAGLVWACEQAIERFEAHEPGPLGWDAIVARGMAVDFDWLTGPAPQYVAAYSRAIQLRRELRRGAPPAGRAGASVTRSSRSARGTVRCGPGSG